MVSALASVAESRIQEALEAGEDMRLSSQGQPIDLAAYCAAPSALRAGFGVLRSAGMVPPEVEAMKELHRLRDQLPSVVGEDARSLLMAEIQLREVELAMALERMRLQLKADAVA